MSVKNDSEKRFVEMSVEVPGTPEQVWHAIATGPGMTAWFVPTELEEREGGAITFHLGPGMDSPGIVTAWEPPTRLAYEERGWSGDAPPLATEVLVETRSGGTCVIRMVHSLFTSSEEWDDQLESMESGWPPYFSILRLYLEHFPGQPSAGLRLLGGDAGSEEETWAALTGALGLTGAAKGERRTVSASAPPLSGVVERAGRGKNLHEMLLRLDEPAPGAAFLGAFTWGGKVQVMVSLLLYGPGVEAVAAREEPAWQRWLDERFPVAVEAGEAT